MNQIKRAVNFLGVSRLVVIGFLLVLMVSVFPLGINPGMIYSDCLVRIGMNGFLCRTEFRTAHRHPLRPSGRLHCSAV